jgi:hypothetical protein
MDLGGWWSSWKREMTGFEYVLTAEGAETRRKTKGWPRINANEHE